MKRILIPVDFSNNSYNALFYATQLLKAQSCQFYILNTFEVKTPVLTSRIDTSKGDRIYKQLSNASQEGLAETFHAITRDTEDDNHNFETISVSKNLITTINKTIVKKEIDLVVMGTKGATKAKQIFMGSNTVKVLQSIKDCPVLIVPDEFTYEKPIEIAFPTDLKRFYEKEELKSLLEIASLFDSAIRIFHIHEEEKLDDIQAYNYNALKRYLKNFTNSIHWISKFTQKARLINDFIEQQEINMLIMVNYKHSLIESITREPIIKRIGFHPIKPFLVVPAAT
ncbi:universal stress protein [Aquimarina pacifica]|uniref:universal stress protein n=1 Tax=Aquimarina pacifica TaxID=1296415 RepID=UPI00046FBA0F|nr:universal stress protein [Aquimarina pacifica]